MKNEITKSRRGCQGTSLALMIAVRGHNTTIRILPISHDGRVHYRSRQVTGANHANYPTVPSLYHQRRKEMNARKSQARRRRPENDNENKICDPLTLTSHFWSIVVVIPMVSTPWCPWSIPVPFSVSVSVSISFSIIAMITMIAVSLMIDHCLDCLLCHSTNVLQKPEVHPRTIRTVDSYSRAIVETFESDIGFGRLMGDTKEYAPDPSLGPWLE